MLDAGRNGCAVLGCVVMIQNLVEEESQVEERKEEEAFPLSPNRELILVVVK